MELSAQPYLGQQMLQSVQKNTTVQSCFNICCHVTLIQFALWNLKQKPHPLKIIKLNHH